MVIGGGCRSCRMNCPARAGKCTHSSTTISRFVPVPWLASSALHCHTQNCVPVRWTADIPCTAIQKLTSLPALSLSLSLSLYVCVCSTSAGTAGEWTAQRSARATTSGVPISPISPISQQTIIQIKSTKANNNTDLSRAWCTRVHIVP
jgi:hypothetical protein